MWCVLALWEHFFIIPMYFSGIMKRSDFVRVRDVCTPLGMGTHTHTHTHG